MEIIYPVVDTVRRRRSVRTFDTKPVAPDLLARIDDFIAGLSNPFGIDVHIHVVHKDLGGEGRKLGTYGIIKGASTFLGVSVPKAPLALLAAGYQFENLVLYVTSLGLGTVWLAATFSRSSFQDAMDIPDSDYFPAICPVGYPLKSRFFEKVVRLSVGADKRKPWHELFFNGDFSTPLSESEAGVYAQALEMLRLAPSATNAQPWRVLKCGSTFHFFEEHKGSADTDTALIKQVDVGIGISHFDLTLQ